MTVSSHACWLTGAERSAVAVIALRGPGAVAALQALFSPRTPRSLDAVKPGAILFGHWANGEEVVVCRTADQWEIQCHGGVAAAPQILDDLHTHRVQRVDPSQWDMAPGQSETINSAWRQLAMAPTIRAAAILLDQAQGAWDRQAREIEQWLSRGTTDSRYKALAAVQRLRQWTDLGRRLAEPWRVALFGAPNAGKSTLINQILGFERSVVYQQAGTTRDLVTAATVVDGWLVEFCDTAGLRRSDDALEVAGIELTETAIAESDLAVEVVDLTHPVATKDLGVSVVPGLKTLRVGNKCDLLIPPAAADVDLVISAETGEGVDELLQRVVSTCIPQAPPPGAAVPFGPICFEQLDKWETALQRG